ncbi:MULTISPECIES: hypothetical protein [Haloferacaceae]|uniref:Uncharacterized protein n=1 Tax=Halorubrum glutamatedens TaxID=2707018 RepID=A0ABD5QQC7_9EURY|nr:hypothetical protein [Halobellus captivus]
MSLPDAEKRRAERRDSRSTDRRDDEQRSDEDGAPNGVYLVAGLALLGGGVDFLSGIAVPLYATGALGAGMRLLFALGSGGSAGGPAMRILLAVVVVGYLLVRADRFE